MTMSHLSLHLDHHSKFLTCVLCLLCREALGPGNRGESSLCASHPSGVVLERGLLFLVHLLVIEIEQGRDMSSQFIENRNATAARINLLSVYCSNT
jgi:hypothetical protein